MLDLQQGLGRNQVSVLSPVYRSNGSSDLDFWDHDGVKFQAQTHEYDDNDDDYGVYSPRLWPSSSPLLPRNHLYSSPLSPKSRLQAIEDGRRELMEMIRDMPESSYELSLKDVVVDGRQEDEKDIVIDERSLKLKPPVEMKQRKKKNCKRGGGQMSRAQSLDSGVFLLKMFFPTSLSLKRKSTTCNRLKVGSPRPSLDGSDKEWWKMRFLAMGDGKKSGKSSIIGSTSSSSSSSSSRQDESDFTPSCWSFHKKCSSRKHL